MSLSQIVPGNNSMTIQELFNQSPQRHMPVEVLASIFEIFKAIHDEAARADQDHYDVSPEVLVSQVNSYFRAVAISTPTLWCQLSVHNSSAVNKVATYLTRSSGCPLDIRIQLFATTPAQRNRLNALLDLLIPQSYRWRALCAFQGLESTDHPLLTRLCHAFAPYLAHLTLEVEDVNSAMDELMDQDVSFPQIFESRSGSSCLEFVRLRGVAMNYFRPQLAQTATLHLEQLKSVPIQYRTLAAILTTPSNLTNLSLSGDIVPIGQWPLRPASLPLPNLLSLRICCVSGEIYARLLVVIHAPRLRSLYLKDVQDSDLDGLWIKHRGIKTIFSSVEKISFLNFDLSPATFEKLCITFPNITTFHTFHNTLETCQFVYLVIERSRGRQGKANILWPMLQHMTARDGKEGKAEKRIDQFIDIRQSDDCPLSSLTLLIDLEDDGEVSVHRSGVKIQFSSVIETWPDLGSSFPDQDDQWYSH